MNTTTILLLILSILIAGGISFYQYFYKVKSISKPIYVIAFLRFITIFGFLLLLINPIISRKKVEIEKTPLPIILDNSESISDLKSNTIALNTFEKIKNNSFLKEKFDIQTYKFSNDFSNSDSIDFKGKQTNIDLVAKNLKNIYKNKTFPTVLITDGNQTTGEDYVFGFNPENKVFPIAVGDTTTYLDLRISQLNVNKYAFHKNKFPVEIFLNYSGKKSCSATFKIFQGTNLLNEQTVNFFPNNKSTTLSALLPADKVGLQIFKATLTSNEVEKNVYNNTKNFAVEIIDQKTEVAIVSSFPHPDLGAIKRAIESNAQRKVTLLKPNEIKSINDFNVLILYQPNNQFKTIFDQLVNNKISSWIITGKDTDFNFLNSNQNYFVFKMSGQKEDYLASYENQFNLFAQENIAFEQFPPLENQFGTIKSKTNFSTLLSSTIHNIPTNQPLITFSDNKGIRSCFLFGENIWKWRAENYLKKKNFVDFDIFIDKTIQYLSTNNARKSLVVNHERFYNSGDAIQITAQYFNKNYELDEKARLTIAVTNMQTKQVKNFDLLRSSNSFQANLDGLSAGNYSFVVKELNSNTIYTSGFQVLDFDIEKQFVNPD